MIDTLDKKIISLLQEDMPLDRRPFAVMSQRAGLSEQEFLDRVKALMKMGIIRRLGATLRHQEVGFGSNAMVAWLVPDERIEDVGEILAGFREVSHCYQRRPQRDWPYNVYTMIHGSDRDQCHKIAEQMSQAAGIADYILLFSEKEFKKTSMEYF